MMPMDPTDAQIILVGVKENNSQPSIGYRRALETIAGMRTEYRAEYQAPFGHWFPTPHCRNYRDTWGTKQEAERNAADWKADGYATRIIRRHVTPTEEVS